MKRSFRALIAFSIFAGILSLAGCGESTGEGKINNKNKQQPIAPKAISKKPKIIALGDSLTAGFGLAEKESYPFLLQQKLDAAGYYYEVINAGVSGDTTLGGLERADWVFDQDDAQILILELGANDLLRGIPVETMKENLDRIITKAKAKNLKILLCGMLAPPNMGVEYQRDFSMAFPDLASKHKVAFLPFLLEGIAMNKDLNQADGIHPNPEGTRIMTENIYRALKPILTKNENR